MTPADSPAFNDLMQSVAEVFNETVSSDRITLYFGALAEYPIEVVRAAMLRGVQTLRFFPKPAEIRELIEGSPDHRALAAWTRVEAALKAVGTYQSVSFDDPILHAGVEQMGGWASAWQWERLDERDYGFKRLEFTRLFGMFLARGVPRPVAHLAGQAEINNRSRGDWTRGLDHRDEVMQIGGDGRPAITAGEPLKLARADRLEA